MKTKISLVSGSWVKQMGFEFIGDKMEGHKHKFDHQTLLAYGKFKVCVEEQCTVYEAPTILYIEKGKEHSIECISEKYCDAMEFTALGFCLHVLRDDETEDIIDPEDRPVTGGTMQGVSVLLEDGL